MGFKKSYIILKITDNRSKFLTTVNMLVNKSWNSLLESTLKIGQLQMLRQKISFELNIACKYEAKHMEAALKTLNE